MHETIQISKFQRGFFESKYDQQCMLPISNMKEHLLQCMPAVQVLAPFSTNQGIKNPPESIDVEVVAICP